MMKNVVSLIASIQKFFEIVNNDKFSVNAIMYNEHTIFKSHEIKFQYNNNEKNNKVIFSIMIKVNNRDFNFCDDEIASDKTF